MAFTRGCLFAKVQGGEVQLNQASPTPIKVGAGASPVGAWTVSSIKLLKNDGSPGASVPPFVLESVFPVSGSVEKGTVALSLTALDDLLNTSPNDYNAIRDSYLNNGIVEIKVPTNDGDQLILVHLRALVSTRYQYDRNANTANPGADPNFNFGTDLAGEYAGQFAPNRYKLPVTTWTRSILPTGAPASAVVAGPCFLRVTRTFATLSNGAGVAAYPVVSDINGQLILV